MPNSFLKMTFFFMLYSALDIVRSLNLFCHFYVTMSSGGWLSYTLHHGLVNLGDGLTTSIKRWKEDFFFVHASTFAVHMTYGVSADRVADATPELSDDERDIIDRLFVNYVKWSDPNETMLGMASLSSHWNKLRKRPLHTIGGKLLSGCIRSGSPVPVKRWRMLLLQIPPFNQS
ncbi:unnamed protein product [Lactuca virosa]|uniref:Uncharacterized protein n=1 Tax=Lactuca virosa TaxID=75947 RepID=A0AAU9NIR2_9ASTR|nr:unnamed protein product [Lactuca virosa]